MPKGSCKCHLPNQGVTCASVDWSLPRECGAVMSLMRALPCRGSLFGEGRPPPFGGCWFHSCFDCFLFCVLANSSFAFGSVSFNLGPKTSVIRRMQRRLQSLRKGRLCKRFSPTRRTWILKISCRVQFWDICLHPFFGCWCQFGQLCTAICTSIIRFTIHCCVLIT